MRVFLMALLVLALGCAGASDRILPEARPVEVGDYRIHAGDQLELRFPLNPELTVTTIVRPDGMISPRGVNEVQAKGLTPAELTEQLRNAYSTELRDPELAVIVRSMAARVYVDGQIEKPGEYVWTRQITAMQAIARAGGFRETASSDQIVVLRRSADGSQRVIQIDLDDVHSGEGEHRDVFLAPYDLVLVPESGISDVNTWVDQYIRKNIPISPREVMFGM